MVAGGCGGRIAHRAHLLGPAARVRTGSVERPYLDDLVVGVGLAACAFTAIWFTVAPGVLRFPATTACLPLLAIAAVRFGPRGAVLANLFTATIVVGVILVVSRPEFNLVLITFLAVASITALALGAVTAERDAAVAKLAADIAARAATEGNLRASASAPGGHRPARPHRRVGVRHPRRSPGLVRADVSHPRRNPGPVCRRPSSMRSTSMLARRGPR